MDTGEIIFANLNLQNNDLQLYKHEYEKNKIDYFDENGKSIKTLTTHKWCSIVFILWKRKHPILGYTKCILEQILVSMVRRLWLLVMGK